MGIDVNDVKILINGGFRYLIKTCHQWAKDHPLVSGVMLFFYLLYIFLPSVFSMLFYTFPLVTCAAILLGKQRITSEKRPHGDIKSFAKTEEKSTSSNQRGRPYLTSQMSRRTFGKDKSKTEVILKDAGSPSSLATWDDPVINKILEEEILPLKMKNESLNFLFENMPSSTTSATSSVFDSEDNYELDYKLQVERGKLVEWTEDDQWNLMDLGSSEAERNERLESLIAKRRARKQLSMQPRRNPLNYLCRSPSLDHHIDQVGVIARAFDDDNEHHHNLVSTFLMKRSRDPFDIPYDSHEERPVLTGGSFDEDFIDHDHVDKEDSQAVSNRGGSNSLAEDPLVKSLPSFFLKRPGFTRFRTDLDAGEGIEEISGELYQQGNYPTPKGQGTPREVQLYRTHSAPHDQSPRVLPDEGKLVRFEGETSAQNVEPKRSVAISSTEPEKDLETKDNAEENIKMNSDPTVMRDEVEFSQQDHMLEKNLQEDDDDNSSSSSSSSNETRIDATKNEAFRNSVKKVLTCLVVRPKNKGLVGKEIIGASSSDPLQDSTPNVVLTTTKMEERSLYTKKPRHVKTFSIASDMQVEVSDPNSPTDKESLIHDGDVDKDANSADEDTWGDSPHPVRLGPIGQPGMKFRLPDIMEETGNELEMSHNADEELPPSITSSPRSILPEKNNNNNQEVLDQKSTDGDILEPRSSCSSASSSSPTSTSRTKGIDSQLPGKTEHLAEYLASLHPSGTESSNTLEDPGPSHVREASAEVISVPDESNAVFEMEESRENSKQTTSTSQPEAPNEGDDHSRTPEDESKAVVEDNFAGHENEVKEEIIDRSLSAEASTPTSEKDKTLTSGSMNEGESKTESLSNPVINVPGPSHAQETSAEVISVQDESNSIFEMEKDKDGSKQRKELEESQENSKEATSTSQPKDPNEGNDHSRTPEDGSKAVEDNFPQSKEETIDQNKEEIIDRPVSAEDSMAMSEKDRTKSVNEGEVKTESPSNPVTNEKSTSPKKPTTEVNQSANDMNILELNEASKEDTEKTQEIKGEPPQSVGVEEGNEKPPSTPGAINSSDIHNRQDGDAYKHDASVD